MEVDYIFFELLHSFAFIHSCFLEIFFFAFMMIYTAYNMNEKDSINGIN